MPENEIPLEDEEEAVEGVDELEDTDTPSDESLDQSDEQEDDPIESLRAEIEGLKKAPPWLSEIQQTLKTEVGRIRSIEARLEKTDNPEREATLRKELSSKLSKSEQLIADLVSGLDETAFADPALKQRAAEALAQSKQEAREAELIQKLRSEMQPKQEPKAETENDWYTPIVQTWEGEWVDRIEEEGFDSAANGDFKDAWQMVAKTLREGGTRQEATAVMRLRLKELKDEREAAIQRQARKQAAKDSPKGAAAGKLGPLDASRSNAERVEYLRSIGALS